MKGYFSLWRGRQEERKVVDRRHRSRYFSSLLEKKLFMQISKELFKLTYIANITLLSQIAWLLLAI